MEVGQCATVRKQSNLEHMDTAHCEVNDKEWEAFKKQDFMVIVPMNHRLRVLFLLTYKDLLTNQPT